MYRTHDADDHGVMDGGCTESGWDGVNFFHSSLFDAVFWICD